MGPWSLLNGVSLAWGDFSHESSDPPGSPSNKGDSNERFISWLWGELAPLTFLLAREQ